jgi:hypothetical protein
MRRVLVSLLAILFSVPGLSARDKSDWANVQKLKPGTPIAILLWAGEQLRGHLKAADASGLRLTWLDWNGTLISPAHYVDRMFVRKIVRFRHSKLPQDPGRIIIISTVAGGAVGATSGAIYDATHHNNAHWLTGGLAGAGIGFLGSCVVLGGIGVIEGSVELFHHSVVVYEEKPNSNSTK